MFPRKLITIGVALVLTLSSASLADTWPIARPRIFAQPQGEYALKVLPDREGVFYTLDESGNEQVIWRAKLVNVPVRAIVSENGKYVVTNDSWARVGHEHSLVIYGEKGKVIADFSLEDLLTDKEIESLPATPSGRWWREKDITEFEDLSLQDELVIRMKHAGWTKFLRVTLSTGKLATRDNEESAWMPVVQVAAINRLRELGAKLKVIDGAVREVDLTASTLSDADLQIVGGLTSLERLILNGCANVTDAGLVHLRNLAKLTTLTLDHTNVSDAGLENLKGLTGLNILSLNWTRTGDAGLKHLEGLVDLGVLYLCDTDVGDAGIASLKAMLKLQWLDLRGTRVTDAGLQHLGNLPRLRLLCLYGIRMTDAGVAALTELPSLEVLTLAQTQVTDAGLKSLAKVIKLKEVDLGGTQVTLAGLGTLQQRFPIVEFGSVPRRRKQLIEPLISPSGLFSLRDVKKTGMLHRSNLLSALSWIILIRDGTDWWWAGDPICRVAVIARLGSRHRGGFCQFGVDSAPVKPPAGTISTAAGVLGHSSITCRTNRRVTMATRITCQTTASLIDLVGVRVVQGIHCLHRSPLLVLSFQARNGLSHLRTQFQA